MYLPIHLIWYESLDGDIIYSQWCVYYLKSAINLLQVDILYASPTSCVSDRKVTLIINIFVNPTFYIPVPQVVLKMERIMLESIEEFFVKWLVYMPVPQDLLLTKILLVTLLDSFVNIYASAISFLIMHSVRLLKFWDQYSNVHHSYY